MSGSRRTGNPRNFGLEDFADPTSAFSMSEVPDEAVVYVANEDRLWQDITENYRIELERERRRLEE